MLNEELVQSLAKSVGWVGYDRHHTGRWVMRDRDLEEFAELIVRECVAVIEPGEFMQGTAHNDTKKIIALNQRKIKQHFGVE